MADLDIYVDDKLLEEISKLAIEHYGDDSEASRGHVVETALEMRILWSRSVKGGPQETVEAVTKWEFSQSPVPKENDGIIRDWLFRR
ncbi:MAG: hypothetical protein Q8O05_04460 [Chloroflexota bacterium]|nr:hypothetical protein [Chloroflexota bacterium]